MFPRCYQFLIGCIVLGLAHGHNSGHCRTTLKVYPNSTLRSSSKSLKYESQLTCINDCLNLKRCLAVEVAKDTETAQYLCVFKVQPKYEDVSPLLYPKEGVTAFVKKVSCFERHISKRSEIRKLADFIVKGDPPAIGPPGPPGSPGLPGSIGPTGPDGPPGDIGNTGFTGERGLPGIMGITGDTGATGLPRGPGSAGISGINGATGISGFMGMPGRRGLTGATGATGPPGRARRSVKQSAGDGRKRYTRSVDNNEMDDYTVYCTVAWKINRYTNYKSCYKVLIQADASGCIDVCLTSGECISVDVQCSSSSSCVCWLHNQPDPVEDLHKCSNITAYGKDIWCSKISPARGPPGPPGSPGSQGPPGSTGPRGRTGILGLQGSPGDTGYTGLPGLRGGTGGSGYWGAAGATGVIGDTGVHGVPGYTGRPGLTGATGATGLPGLSMRKRSAEDIQRRSVRSVRSVRSDCNLERIDYCVLYWNKIVNISFKSPYRGVVEKTLLGCLNQCKDSPGCLAIDVDDRNTSEFYTCWLHNDPQDEEDTSNVKGRTSYIKQLACSRNIPSIGPPGLPGQPGPTGISGQPGRDGFRGITGVVGLQGPSGIFGMTGITGHTGINGNSGPTGPTGAPGRRGDVGVPGIPGVPGEGGVPGETGHTGPSG